MRSAGGLFLALLLIAGCSNNGIDNAIKKLTTKVGGGGTQGNLISISAVVKSINSPGNFEVVGDGESSIGGFCSSFGSSGSGGSAPPCQCVFEYSDANAKTVKEEVPVSYAEENMARCSFSSLSSNSAKTVSVSLKSTSGFTSNSITVNFLGVSGALDLSSTLSFLKVNRLQCRDIVNITSPYCDFDTADACMYNPILSMSTLLSYPLNYFSTNFGGALLTILQQSSGGNSDLSKWECAMDPVNPPGFYNPYIYSEAPDSSGSSLIYPPQAGTFDRFTFYLAKKPSGIFTEPLNAMVAPGLSSKTPDSTGVQPSGTAAPIGYGARPITTAQGEVCPSSTLPNGWEWVKVWLFIGDLVPRRYIASSPDIQKSGEVMCNPDTFDDGSDVFKDCDPAGGNPAPDLATITGSELAARVFFSTSPKQACTVFPVNSAARAGYINTGEAGESDQHVTFQDFIDGSDVLERWDGNSKKYNPMNVAGQLDFDSDSIFDAGDQGVPFTDDFIEHDLDSSQSRFDTLFTVSPPTITFDNIKNKSGDAAVYYPYTYKRKEDCNQPDPTGDSTCVANQNKITKFNPLSINVGTPPNEAPKVELPLCAVRPKQ